MGTKESSLLRRRGVLRSALAGLALALFGVPAMADAPLRIVATTGMIADAARTVGGDLVEVKALMGSGVDPHAYRQTRSDIVAMTRADLVLWHGLFLEAQMERFFEDLSRKRHVVAVADGLPRDLLRAHDSYADKFDPHVWMDPAIWSFVVAEIETALTEAYPDGKDIFARNAAVYRAQLADLTSYATETLSKVPDRSRILVTAHDAFGYFGASYGFEVLGIQGISTESEAGLNRISSLVDLLVDRGIEAVFVETSVSDRNMRALIEGAAARGHTVRVGGELYSDAMGPDGSYEGTYLGMIDHNVTTIAHALGADVTPSGMSGDLAVGG